MLIRLVCFHQTFWVSGSCPYGKRCCFIHTELPVPGAPGNPNPPPGPGVVENRSGDGSGPVTSTTTPNPPTGDSPSAAHTRSTSTASDANEQPSSLLARISAKRGANNEVCLNPFFHNNGDIDEHACFRMVPLRLPRPHRFRAHAFLEELL